VKPSDTSAVPTPKNTAKNTAKNAVGAAQPAKNAAATPSQPPAPAQAVAGKVPLPEARPVIKPDRVERRHRRIRYYRRQR